MYKPYTVYYMHFVDERHIINNWNVCRDYACCVMARTINEAIELTKSHALNQQGAIEIKIIGIGHCKEEWTELPQPIKTDNARYAKEAQAAIERAKQHGVLFKDQLKYKFEL
jgi:hypothetical protein